MIQSCGDAFRLLRSFMFSAEVDHSGKEKAIKATLFSGKRKEIRIVLQQRNHKIIMTVFSISAMILA